MAAFISGIATGIGISGAAGNATGITQRLLGKQGRVQFVGTRGVLLQLDATLSEEHGRDATVTKYPVEDGSQITDHIILEPQALSITGMVSDTPLSDLKTLLTESAGAPVNAILGPLGVVAGSAAYALYKALKGARSPSVAAFAQLCKMQAGNLDVSPPAPPEPFDVLTGLRRYKSMVIQSLSVPRSPSNGNSIQFTVKLVQLTIVAPQRVPLRVLANSKLAGAKKKTGDQELDDLGKEVREKAKAGLAREKALNIRGVGPS